MNEEIRELLEGVKGGEVSVEEALLKLKTKPFEDIGYAKVDMHRKVRQGVAEVIYGAGKTAKQITGIVKAMLQNGQETILITRLDEEKEKALEQGLKKVEAGQGEERMLEGKDRKATNEGKALARKDREATIEGKALARKDREATIEGKALAGGEGESSGKVCLEYFREARCAVIGRMPKPSGTGKIVICTGGTSDVPVAEEAAITATVLGNEVVRLYDVGVAGIHRTLAHMDDIMSASVIIAIAGMEGALASVVGGLADCPVIAVPTSVGYGASFHGLSALLSMLNSCASGVSVVNIDNGFGAGYLASMINHPKRS